MNINLIHNVLIIFIFKTFTSLYGTDTTIPQNGNLYFANNSLELPLSIEILKNDSTNSNSFIYYNSFTGFQVNLLNFSGKYPHGILGDPLEPTKFVVTQESEIIGSYQLSNDVFETLRATIGNIDPTTSDSEILLTRSSSKLGARVDVYSKYGKFLGASNYIGRGFRWLHILAVANFYFDDGLELAIVKTPHLGGILEFYKWKDGRLQLIESKRGFSTHKIGSTNLNMAIAINVDNDKYAELILPSNDYRKLMIVKLTKNGIVIIDEIKVPGVITNLFFEDVSNSILVELDKRSIVRLYHKN
ncbi:MAG: hypothetical protein OCD02_00715 [Spirochaetaceae bacterium]